MLCEEIDMKLYIIANRLPVKVAGTNGKFAFSRSEGGLATGLDSLQTSYEKHWIGWPGICANEEKDQQEINEKLQEMNFHPVFLSEKQLKITTKDIVTVLSGLYAITFMLIPYIRTVFGNPTSKSTVFSVRRFADWYVPATKYGYRIIS